MTALRQYQINAVTDIEQALAAGFNVLFVLPTGAGKTIIATAIVESYAAAGKRVLILTHRREILRQTSKTFCWDHGLVQAGLEVDLSYPIQIASIQTLWSRWQSGKISLPAAQLIVIDEAHHVRANTWSKLLLEYPNARRLGLTATPCRGDGRGLGNYFNKLIEGPQIPELINAQPSYLVKTVYFAPVDPDLKGVGTRQGDYVIEQLAQRIDRPDLVGNIVSDWHKHAENRKTMIFAVNVAHSINIRDEFIKAGIRCEHIDGSTPKPERDAALGRLKSGDTQIVCNCNVLTEGFDAPEVSCIVLARPTKQLGLFRQMAGRGLRPCENKSDLRLLDHSGAVFRHGALEDPILWQLAEDQRAKNTIHSKLTSTQQRDRFVDCKSCGALRTPGQACPNCGFLPQRRGDAISFRDGELARVNAGGRNVSSYGAAERQRWLQELAHIGRARSYKAGWASYKYKDKFGLWPPYGIAVTPKPATAEVLGWVRSRDIAFAKARQKARA
jgi:DNA repair protein RadD